LIANGLGLQEADQRCRSHILPTPGVLLFPDTPMIAGWDHMIETETVRNHARLLRMGPWSSERCG